MEDSLPTLYQHTCSRCKTTQDIDQFYRNDRYTSGFSSYCKTCMREYTTKWTKDNPTKMQRIRRDAHLRQKYGMSYDDYAILFARQDGRCGICGGENDRALAVDHCHSTGAIRGLLCDNCNHGLGKFKDDPAMLRTAAQYLERVV